MTNLSLSLRIIYILQPPPGSQGPDRETEMTFQPKDFTPVPRGGAAVGFLDELGPLEAGAVRCLRAACEGPGCADWHRLAAHPASRDALDAVSRLCTISARFGRRPLMRHSLSCACLGADEACVAQIVVSALAGERDDAMLMASLLVRADMAPALVAEAEMAGAALTRAQFSRDVMH